MIKSRLSFVKGMLLQKDMFQQWLTLCWITITVVSWVPEPTDFKETTPLTGANRIVVPFIACGDLSGYDADQNYIIESDDYRAIEAVQKPIDPPYKKAKEMKRDGHLQVEFDDTK